MNANDDFSARQPDVIHHATRMAQEARALGTSLGAAGRKLNASLDLPNRIHRNPIACVAAALGVGYVLGGGLFSPTTKKLLKVGMRLAVIPFVKGQLAAIAGVAAGEPL